MRQPRVAAAVILAIVLAGAIAVAVGSREDRGAGALAWEGAPEVFAAPGLPRDGILAGQVRNDTLERVRLEAADLVVVDDRGRRWRTAGRFMAGFAHGLWPPGQQVAAGSDAERERLGEIARLEPGETAPLTVAWTRPRGAGRPARIEVGGGRLAIPRGRAQL